MKDDQSSERVSRSYRMKARAEAAQITEEQIMAAAFSLFSSRPYEQVSLDEIASQAHVTAQTVIRRFGSKEQLFRIVCEQALARAIGDRERALTGNTEQALENLIHHYEQWGNLILHLQKQAAHVPTVRAVTEVGRLYHHQWIERVFSPMLVSYSASVRVRRLAQLIAITDVHVWEICRHERHISVEETTRAFVEVVTALLASSPNWQIRDSLSQ